VQTQLCVTVTLYGKERIELDRYHQLTIDNLTLDFFNAKAYQAFREDIAEALGLILPEKAADPEYLAEMIETTAATVAE
jgi:hypothetical protein